MKIFVQDCFHWIGFHIVEQLVSNGYNVYGKHETMTSQAEFLSHFLGRHSLFHHVNDDQGSYDLMLKLSKDNKTDKLIMSQHQDNKSRTITLPIVFGEWMEMDENGMLINGERLDFHSSTFLKQAIYIGDVIKGLMQWLTSTYLPEDFMVYSTRNDVKEDIKLDKTIYIRDNRPIENRLEQLFVHYYKYKEIYYHV